VKGILPQNGGANGASTRTGLVMATREGRLLCAPGAMREWLQNYFGPPQSARMLPPRIVTWLASLKENGDALPLVAKLKDSKLTVSLVHPEAEDGVCLLLKIQPRPAPPATPTEAKLTVREREVLALLSDGNSDRQIAQILGISERTAGKHVEHIFEKLNVKNRAAAAAVAVLTAREG
jgi:DNA-binding CsgD family transcriptional regulator